MGPRHRPGRRRRRHRARRRRLHAARPARAGWSDRGCRRDRAPDARPGAGRARRRALVDAGYARHGDAAEAAGIAAALDATSLPNARVATVAVRALLDDDRIAAAIRLGDAALERATTARPARLAGPGAPAPRHRGRPQDPCAGAFRAGLAASPSDVRLLTLHGETLLRAGRQGRRIATGTGHRPGAGTGTDPRPMRARCATRSDTTRPPISSCIWSRSLRTSRYGSARPSARYRRRAARARPRRCSSGTSRNAPCACRRPSGSPGPLDGRLDSAPFRKPPGLAWLRGDAGRPRAGSARAGAIWWIICFDWLECREDSVESHAAAGRAGHRRTLRAAARRAEAWWWPPPTSVPCTPA